MMPEKVFLNMIMNYIKKSARFFKDSDAILRMSESCPSKELHEKGIAVLDDVIMKICERMGK